MTYEPTIGLEIHVELKTRTKMFCNNLNDPNERHPNVNICEVCLAHPGSLPTINQEAIQKLIKVGLALNCEVAEFSKFNRKNYFYPDLPKGYQISQYDMPLCKNGYLEIKRQETSDKLQVSEIKKIRIERIHIEEDTGRLQHSPDGKYSLVDFNRAGVPLMELVTTPDLKSGKEIEEFAKELRLILRYLDASDADMEKAQMRIEVNISVRDKRQETSNKLGTKVELKNINSIKAAAAAADYEIKRQTELLESGGKVVQETRGWDENKQKTFSQRLKEGSADYRYFPEPDLPPIRIANGRASLNKLSGPPLFSVEEIRLSLPELPAQRRKRFKEQYDLTDSQIEVFTIAKHLGDYYEKVVSEMGSDKDAKAPQELQKLAANYIITEFPPLIGAVGMEIDEIEGLKIEPEAFAELMVMVFHEKLSSTGAKTVLKRMAETGLHPEVVMKELGLEQISDTGELERAVDEVVAENPKAVEDYKKGKVESLKYLVGQVMAQTRGRANPQVVGQLLEKKLAR